MEMIMKNGDEVELVRRLARIIPIPHVIRLPLL